uniref:ribosomal protein S10 n=1 Tax=Ishige okamurae TaxID=233772 RepID=UPI002E767282|nr:ribosomal protein S10 [Ishige okamurae]WBP70186.1 ribosomal protein S10 [Ishige okamurae]
MSTKKIYLDIYIICKDLDTLQDWFKLAPLNMMGTVLGKKIRSFTLPKSPLANKKSKDQYAHVQYFGYVKLKTRNVNAVLATLEILSRPVGVTILIYIKT